MKISLYILARNEAARIVGCVAPLAQLFDDIIVIDDASTDGTADVLQRQVGIRAHRVDSARFPCMGAVRNLARSLARHPWVFKLDADELLWPAHARLLLEMPEPRDVAGFFCAWRTFAPDGVIEDYKLPLARRDCIETGLAHENLQQDMRRRGLHARWLAEVELLHHPDPSRVPAKNSVRRLRLRAALQAEPAWYRHHWFLGYMDYLEGDFAAARLHLETVARARPREFPVECLNSFMVLADIAARGGDASATVELLEAARSFHSLVHEDFEVRVNFRAAGWIDQALRDAREGKLPAVRAYAFSR